MKSVAFSRIISVSNEIKGHSAENLLETEPERSWLCRKGSPNGSVVLALETPTVVNAVRVINDHSAFVEVLAGNDGEREEKFQTLVPSSAFMNPHESRKGIDPGRERLFRREDLCPDAADKKWKFIRIVCWQPYNDGVPFGVRFVGVGSGKDEDTGKIESRGRRDSDGGKLRERSNKNDDSSGKRSRKDAETPKKRRKVRKGGARPFSRLMEDVVFVLSGMDSPRRKEIRRRATEMGASYSPDWHSDCTHLICSRRDTPEYRELKGTGKIAREEWIRACHEDGKRYPWRRYALDEDEAKMPESEEEISSRDDDDDAPTAETSAKATKRTSDDPYATDTDEDECKKPDTTDYPMPFLPDFFAGKTFYVDPGLSNCSRIERYIVAYKGILAENVTEDVEFYVTNIGGAVLQIFRKKAPKMRAVSPAWIWEVNGKSEWTSPWKFLL